MSSTTGRLLLLIQKNLKIRTTHAYMSCCELIFPVAIALIAGGLICSVEQQQGFGGYFGDRGGSYCWNYTGDIPSQIPPRPADYRCPHLTRFDNLEKLRNSKVVYAITISPKDSKYAIAEAVISKIVNGPYQLSQEVVQRVIVELRDGYATPYAEIQHALKQEADRLEQEHRSSGITNWIQFFGNSSKPENISKQLETCLLTLNNATACEGREAAVIITDVVDEVSTGKFKIEYTIRMGKRFETQTIIKEEPEYSEVESNYVGSFVCLPSKHHWNALCNAEVNTRREIGGRNSDEPDIRGFTHLQAYIDRGIRDYIKEKKGITDIHDLRLVRMPWKPDKQDDNPEYFLNAREIDVNLFGITTSTLMSLFFALPIFSAMRVNAERSSGFKEFLRMHGVSSGIQWMAWLISCAIVYLIWTGLIATFLSIPLGGFGKNLTHKNDFSGILFWILLFLYSISITTFCFFLSVFFQKVWTAVTVGLVCWIIMVAFMFVFTLALFRQSTITTLLYMLMPPSAYHLGYAMLITGGGNFDTMFKNVNPEIHLSLASSYAMLLFDSAIFMILAMYLDNIFPSKYGVAKPPTYIFRASEWSCCLSWMSKKRGVSPSVQRVSPEDPTPTPLETNQPERIESTASRKSRKTNNADADLVDAPPPESLSTVTKEALQSGFEPDPTGLVPIVEIDDLRKSFGPKKQAVNGLNAKMFHGEIYALLGHNGAGKTTTMSMLTGLMSPTTGSAKILGLDIKTEMEEIRRHIGLCPQHNLLFDEMSIQDHVSFFGMLKGLSRKEAILKAVELLTWLDLSSKLRNKPNQLSGGQKRRVHLAIALIGQTKLAFLDEPSSGLDPETRREVWTVLLQLRNKISVIITTHHMEEADVLGDRIGIMSAGKMVCSGTSSYLKKYYGTGYNLKMSIAPSCKPQDVADFVKKYVPKAKPEIAEPGATEMSIALPTLGLEEAKLGELMEQLRSKKESLGVDNIGLSLSTMDEVFIKAGEADEGSHNNPSTSTKKSSDVKLYQNPVVLTMSQYFAVLKKRFLYFLRAPVGILLMVLFVVTVYFVCAERLGSLSSLDPVESHQRVIEPARLITFSDYNKPTTIYHGDSEATSLASIYNGVASASSASVPEQVPRLIDLLARFDKPLSSDLAEYRKKYVVGSAFFKKMSPHGPVNPITTVIHGFYSKYALHSPALSLNMISKALIKEETGVDANITVKNHPFRHPAEFSEFHNTKKKTDNNLMISISLTLLTVIIMNVLTSLSTSLPLEERLNMGKHLQLMTGMSPVVYWLATFTWDFLFYTVVNLLLTLLLLIVDASSQRWLYTNKVASNGGTFFLILESFTFSSLWFCYLISLLPTIKANSGGFLTVNIIYLVVGIVLESVAVLIGMVLHFFSHTGVTSLAKWFDLLDGTKYGFWVIPPANLYQAVYKYFVANIANTECAWHHTIDGLLDEMCKSPESKSSSTTFITECCGNCTQHGKCFEKTFLWTKESVISFGLFLINDNTRYSTHGLPFDILAMVSVGILYALLLFFLECLPNLRVKLQGKSRNGLCNASPDIRDDDVRMERNQVENVITGGPSGVNSEAMLVYNLAVQFKKFKAVNDLSFMVHHGECFGLLGINGAGKTTTFRMLTGDLFPSSGQLFLNGVNYYTARQKFLSSLGYCPQFDGIVGGLNGREMLMLYGALRGVPWSELKKEADLWLEKFGLLESAGANCENYSGGMKRRLSAAMASIGNPKILLLDEPTTGVDPVSRRQFWDIIKEIKEGGQSVILTSHTMDECEALCGRLGIMVNGQFQCLGGVQQLKSKFGEGFTLEIKLKRVPPEESPAEQIDILNSTITSTFFPCTLTDKHDITVTYRIQNTSLWYSDVFSAMEDIRKTYTIILEYSVVESSLEDIFISFARQQQEQTLLTVMHPSHQPSIAFKN